MLLHGWNPDLDIPSALDRVIQGQLAEATALLSMIDSTPDVAGMVTLIPRLKRAGRSYTVVERDVAIELSTLIALCDDQFLTGFDEVWLYPDMPRRGKPQTLRITSDMRLTAPQEGLSEWMIESGCLVGLGDGDGLNFATFDERLAALWSFGR